MSRNYKTVNYCEKKWHDDPYWIAKSEPISKNNKTVRI